MRSDDCLEDKQQEEDEDKEDNQIDNDVVDIDSPIVKLIEQLDLDGHVSEQDDEEEHGPDGYDEAGPIQPPRTGKTGTWPPPRAGRALFHETQDSRSRLDAMLTEEGEHIRATRISTRGTYSLSTTHALVKSTPIPDVGVKFCDRPLFAVRADLAKAGLMHEHRVLGNNTQYNSSDPASGWPYNTDFSTTMIAGVHRRSGNGLRSARRRRRVLSWRGSPKQIPSLTFSKAKTPPISRECTGDLYCGG